MRLRLQTWTSARPHGARVSAATFAAVSVASRAAVLMRARRSEARELALHGLEAPSQLPKGTDWPTPVEKEGAATALRAHRVEGHLETGLELLLERDRRIPAGPMGLIEERRFTMGRIGKDDERTTNGQ